MATVMEKCSVDELVDLAKRAKYEADELESQSSPSRWTEADCYAALSDHGLTQAEIAKRCGTTQSTISKFISCAKNYSLANNRPAFWDAYQEVDGKTSAQRIVASTENEWYTPKRYIDAARKVLGGIDLDPASSKRANRTVQSAEFFAAEDEGENKPWHGRVWLNPPYGRLAGEFAQRAVLEYQAGEITAAILLLNAHCTDTDWFKPLWDFALCFTDHRIDFDSNGRDKSSTSTHGSVFVYLGNDTKKFKDEFSEFGAVVKRL